MVKAFNLPGFHQSDPKSESDSDLESEHETDEESDFESESELCEELFMHLPYRDGCYSYALQLVEDDLMHRKSPKRSSIKR